MNDYIYSLLRVARAADEADALTEFDLRWLTETGMPEQTPGQLTRDAVQALKAAIGLTEAGEGQMVRTLINAIERDSRLLDSDG